MKPLATKQEQDEALKEIIGLFKNYLQNLSIMTFEVLRLKQKLDTETGAEIHRMKWQLQDAIPLLKYIHTNNAGFDSGILRECISRLEKLKEAIEDFEKEVDEIITGETDKVLEYFNEIRNEVLVENQEPTYIAKIDLAIQILIQNSWGSKVVIDDLKKNVHLNPKTYIYNLSGEITKEEKREIFKRALKENIVQL